MYYSKLLATTAASFFIFFIFCHTCIIVFKYFYMFVLLLLKFFQDTSSITASLLNNTQLQIKLPNKMHLTVNCCFHVNAVVIIILLIIISTFSLMLKHFDVYFCFYLSLIGC